MALLSRFFDAASALWRRIQIWDKFQVLVQKFQTAIPVGKTPLNALQNGSSPTVHPAPHPPVQDRATAEPRKESATGSTLQGNMVNAITKAMGNALPPQSQNSAAPKAVSLPGYSTRERYKSRIEKLHTLYSRIGPKSAMLPKPNPKPSSSRSSLKADPGSEPEPEPEAGKAGPIDDYDNQVVEFVYSSLAVALPEPDGLANGSTIAFQTLIHDRWRNNVGNIDTDIDRDTDSDSIDQSTDHVGTASAVDQQRTPSKQTVSPEDKDVTKNYRSWDYKIYAGLRLDESSIRLVDISPGSPHDQVIVCMAVYPLDEVSMRYEALSYVWGKPKPAKTILVGNLNNKEKVEAEVNPNLHDALVSLRQPNSARRVWIDAICINQTSTAEKSKEVRKMGQIYGLAKTVNIFLGAPSPNQVTGIDVLFRYLERDEDGEAVQRLAKEGLSAVENFCEERGIDLRGICKGFTEVFLQPWWSRIWTLQEFYLAEHEPVWYWGSVNASNASLKRNFRLLAEVASSLGFTSIDVERLADLISRRYSTNGFESPVRLYRQLTNREASNPKDLVYGLRALFDPVFGSVFAPDYRMHTELLFACLAVFLIQFECWGDVLWWYPARYAAEKGPFPSWLPDFTRHVVPHELDVRPLDQDPEVMPEPKLVVLGHRLYAEGYVLDKVSGRRDIDKSDGEKILQDLWLFDHALNDDYECHCTLMQSSEHGDLWSKIFLDMCRQYYADRGHPNLGNRTSILQLAIKPKDHNKLPRHVTDCIPCWQLLLWHALRIDSPDLSEAVKQLIGGADEGYLENVFSDKMDSTFRDSVANFFIGACIFDWVRVSIWLNRFPHSTCWSDEDGQYWSELGKEDVETVVKTLSDAYRKFEAEIQSEMMRTGWCPPSYYTILGYAILLDCSDHESLTNVIRRLQAAGNKLRTIYFSTKIDELALTVPSIAASLKHRGTVVDLFRGRHLLWTEGGLRGISCPGVETHCDQKSVLAVVDGMSFPVIVQDYEKGTGEGWLDGFAVICGVDMLNQDTVKAVLPLGFQRGEKTNFKFGTGVEREKTESQSPPEPSAPSGRTFIPLHHAAKYAQCDEVRRLLDASEPVDERAGDGSTALHYAVHWSGSFDICALLLQRGANPNAQRSTDGFAPLHELVSSSYRKDRWAINFLDELYAHGADIHLRAFQQQSVLGLAASQNLATCIRRLIDLGAHPDSPLQWYSSNSGFGTGFRSALGIAAWHAHIETMRVLIDAKADVNYNDFGQTPLLEIVCNRGASNDPNRYTEGARMLLDAGADVNLATTKGSGFITPLGRALYNGNVELTRLLIKRGANPNIINSDNESPVSMARSGEHAPIIRGGNAEMIKFAETLPLSQ